MLDVEGVCRCQVDALLRGAADAAASKTACAALEEPLPYDTVLVTQLEPDATVPQVQQPSPPLPALGAQLVAATKQLLDQLSKQAGVTPASRTLGGSRLLAALTAEAPERAADMVAAALSTAHRERLAVLHAVDPRQRVLLALALVRSAVRQLGGRLEGHAARPAARGRGPVLPGDALGPSSHQQQQEQHKRAGDRGSSQHAPGTAAGPGVTPAVGAGSSGSSSEDALDGAVGRQAEDGGGGEEGEDLDELAADGLDGLAAKLRAAQPPLEVLRSALRELHRLRGSSESSPGFAAARTYLELLAELPWSRTTEDERRRLVDAHSDGAAAAAARLRRLPPPPAASLRAARELLDRQHHGLDEIKQRVVSHLAVLRLRGASAGRAPILCFLGPPGVGKTSLGRSVADALGRPFVRIALGGVRDEAEIRGHRRTYVGALPGRIVQAIRRCGVCDPVVLLDEVDKLGGAGAGGRDAVRGDPAAALLEVLDPEQNSGFVDAYVGHPFDLSRVTFVATANRASDIPGPLLDRLEVLSLSGYTAEEKAAIASAHLLPAALADAGLPVGALALEHGVLNHIITGYTREAGVRGLARCLGAVCRRVAVQLVSAADSAAERQEAQRGGRAGGLAGAEAEVEEVGVPAPPGVPLDQPLAPDAAAAARAGAVATARPAGPVAGARARGDGGHPHGGRGGPAAAELVAEVAAIGSLQHALRPAAAAQAATAAVGGPTAASNFVGGGSGGWRFLRGPWAAAPHASAAASAGGRPAPAAAPPGHASPATSRPSASRGGYDGALAPAPRGAPARAQLAAARGQPGRRGVAGALQTHLQPQPPAPPPPSPLLAAEHLPVHVDLALVEEVLGPPVYDLRGGAEAGERLDGPGVAAGLVWTAAGGSVQYVEAVAVGPGQPGQLGRLTLTGQAGEVLDESAKIAMSWIRAHAQQLGLGLGVGGDGAGGGRGGGGGEDGGAQAGEVGAGAGPAAALCQDIHVHLPAGAVPKDGPSAGITLAVALVSLLTRRAVRPDTALTGELTLRGVVLPVGGVKEKLLAARQAGLRRVLVPARCLPEVAAKVPAAVRDELQVVGVRTLEEVLEQAFEPPVRLMRARM